MNGSQETREHISNKFQEYEKRSVEEEYRKRLLDSLWFSEILSREETIVKAHRETFEWIFDESGKAVRPWDNFNAWLKNGKDIYWISGKAGSGKSTLMSFLGQDKRTRETLMSWSGTKDLLMPKFFFWSSGSESQRSLEGLLRSLLWQILTQFCELALPQFDNQPQLEHDARANKKHILIGAWTKSRLQRALEEVINQLRASCCLCLFIDGLDEFEEDDDELIAFVRNLVVSNTEIKVCLSSRPHQSFEDAFKLSAKLRLQDLTYQDIRRFVTDRFEEVPQLRSMMKYHEIEIKHLKDSIVEKAGGVFLWVSLAVQHQIRGLKNGDGPEMLRERLALLPPEIEGVYSRMLHQIDRLYYQEASHFLRMALHRSPSSLLQHALVSYKGLEDMLLSANEVSKQEFDSLCQKVGQRILVTCAGLLEIHQPISFVVKRKQPNERSSEKDSEQLNSSRDDNTVESDFYRETGHSFSPSQEVERPYSNSTTSDPTSASGSVTRDAKWLWNSSVIFVHRTAVEFLRNSASGKEFLEGNSSPTFNPQVSYVKALLGEMRIVGDKAFVDYIMVEATYVEDSTGIAQISLCELIDHTMSIIDRRDPEFHRRSHWRPRSSDLAKLYNQGHTSWRTSSSRSSSHDSYYSATRAMPVGSPYFLGLAAWYGLSGYVQQVLDREQKGVDPELLNYVLFCSVIADEAAEMQLHVRKRVDLVLQLLNWGADPNAKLLGKTIWVHFLEHLFLVWKTSIFRPDVPPPDSQTLTTCAIAFIEHSADVISSWPFHFEGSLQHRPIVQLSALSLIKAVMQNKSGFSQILETAINRGAVYHSRWTLLEVEDEGEHEDDFEYLEDILPPTESRVQSARQNLNH